LTEATGEQNKQSLLLLGRQGHHGILDFGKSAHRRKVTHARTPDKREA